MDDLERRLRDLGDRTDQQLRAGVLPRRRIVRRARLRRAVVVGAPVLAAVALAAVVYPVLDRPRDLRGGGIELAAVAATTEAAGTARIELEMTIDAAGESGTTSVSGVVDFETGRSRLVMEESGHTIRVEVLTIGNSLFQRSIDDDGAGRSKWHETKLSGAGGIAPDPSDYLGYLRTMSDDVTRVGEDTLDGVAVTRYRVEIERPSLGVPEDVHFELDPMEVWVDAQGRLRRLTFGGAGGGPSPESQGSMHMSMQLSDFGVPVDVVKPDPENVTDDPPPWEDWEPEYSVGQSTTVEGSPPELDEFGVDEWFEARGAGGSDGPSALVTITEGSVGVCIQYVPRATTRSTLVDGRSGEQVVTIAGDPDEKNPYARGGCTMPTPKKEWVDRLRIEPELFELRFEREKGPDVVVPLTEVVGPPE